MRERQLSPRTPAAGRRASHERGLVWRGWRRGSGRRAQVEQRARGMDDKRIAPKHPAPFCLTTSTLASDCRMGRADARDRRARKKGKPRLRIQAQERLIAPSPPYLFRRPGALAPHRPKHAAPAPRALRRVARRRGGFGRGKPRGVSYTMMSEPTSRKSLSQGD